MNLEQLIAQLEEHFPTKGLDNFKDESASTYNAGKDIQKIGYATNLTEEVIEKAKEAKVDLIITHHDAWSFITGLPKVCQNLLEAYGISHYFNHLPLDDAPFGTNQSLAKALGLKDFIQVNQEEGFYCGLVGEFETPQSFEHVREKLSSLLDEPVQAWQFHDRLIKRVHIICGAGHLTSDIQIGLDHECDLYITGEKILYTVEFAALKKFDLMVGSHTFIELLGVRGMAEMILTDNPQIQLIQLGETHLETIGFN